MHVTRLVILGIALVFVFGCQDRKIDHFSQEKPIDGCRYANESEGAAIISDAKKIFIREVGVKISSIQIDNPSVCATKTVTTIHATTESTRTPRIWFVEIDAHDPSKFEIIRPE